MITAQSVRIAGMTATFCLLCLLQSNPVFAGSPPPYPPGWQHRGPPAAHHYYPRPGPRYVVVDRLPHGCRRVVYRGQPYYYRGADWYRPHGVRFAAVAPPAGVIIDRRGVALVASFPLVRW